MKGNQGTYLRTLAAGIAAVALLMTNGAGQAAPITEPEANAIALDAYVYFYPLVTMDITRKQLVNAAHPEGIHAPMNTFISRMKTPARTRKPTGCPRPRAGSIFACASAGRSPRRSPGNGIRRRRSKPRNRPPCRHSDCLLANHAG